MIFKVFGKTNNNFSKWVIHETIKKLKESVDGKDRISVYDIDKPLGKQTSLDENIYYVPTIICENDEGLELGYVENKFALGNETMIQDMNRCGEWWIQLKDFIEDMDDMRDK